MSLYCVLNLEHDKRELISFVGGGGKTSSMFQLAKELKKRGKRVLVTTTTAIYRPTRDQYDHFIVMEEIQGKDIKNWDSKTGITVLGGTVSTEDKLLSPKIGVIEEIHGHNLFDIILVEADGAKKMPIKAPSSHEPVIPQGTTKVIGIIGMDALEGRIIEDTVHRWELFCKITNSQPQDIITPNKVVSLVTHPQGMFKGAPGGCERYLLLNKTDNQRRKKVALKIIELLKLDSLTLKGIIVSSMIKQEFQLFKWGKDND